MSAFWIILLLLLLAACALFLAAVWRQRQASAGDRDRLNQRFYHQQLIELAQAEEQGVVAEWPVMERELQQTLLADIPLVQTEPAHSRRRWILLPGLILLLAVPVAVKRMPLSRFPLSLTLDDSNAMMPKCLLSA